MTMLRKHGPSVLRRLSYHLNKDKPGKDYGEKQNKISIAARQQGASTFWKFSGALRRLVLLKYSK